MSLIKGNTYLAKTGKTVKILWQFRYRDIFVGVYSPHEESETIRYYTSNGSCIESFEDIALGNEVSNFDIVDEYNSL